MEATTKDLLSKLNSEYYWLGEKLIELSEFQRDIDMLHFRLDEVNAIFRKVQPMFNQMNTLIKRAEAIRELTSDLLAILKGGGNGENPTTRG